MRGELVNGELLPSIHSLAKELQISVITTKRAYEELENNGFIETVPCKGSYVSGQNNELLKEKRLKEFEDNLDKIVTESKLLGLSFGELQEMLKFLYYDEV